MLFCPKVIFVWYSKLDDVIWKHQEIKKWSNDYYCDNFR